MSRSFKFGFDVVMEKGSLPRPVAVKPWATKEKIEQAGPQKPFKYMADALCGLALMRMNPHLKCPVSKPGVNAEFCEKAWTNLDPHWELWQRSRNRVESLYKEVNKVDEKTCAAFEADLMEIYNHAMKPEGVDLRDLWKLIDCVSVLETRKNSPLLYNFGLKFTPQFTSALHSLYSFLFHLRSLVAVDLNAHVDDPSHEAVRVDSITDYLPKAEYVVNDALIYWQFEKLAKPFTAGRSSDVKFEKLFVEPLRRAFHTSSHNACHLIEHLPKNFLERLSLDGLDEALYHVQMDWLLGSEAGLLFRIREELFGLQNGYNKIFWHEYNGAAAKKSYSLGLCFELKESDLHSGHKAA